MKFFNVAVALFLVSSTVIQAAEDDHDHEVEELCSEFNVTDATTCGTWCGEDMPFEYTYLQTHGDFEDIHVDYLRGWECHCESSGTETEEKHCLIPYELPTCESKGLADCGSNATMTCGDLCKEVGLGLDNSTTAVGRRFLDHITDTHFCAHHDEEHNHRNLAEDQHDHEEPVTICYCNAGEEAEKDATIACSDADLDEGHGHGKSLAHMSSKWVVVIAIVGMTTFAF